MSDLTAPEQPAATSDRSAVFQINQASLSSATSDSPAPPRAVDFTRTRVGAPIKAGAYGLTSWIETDQAGVPPLVLKTPLTEAKRAELQHEADAYAMIGPHPNVAVCHGMRTVGDQTGLVLEGISGRDMAGTMKVLEKLRTGTTEQVAQYGLDRQISQEEFVGILQNIAMEMLRGMARIEEAGVVHNDIRPDNIMIDGRTGGVKIIDLGLAQDLGAAPIEGAPVQAGGVSPDRAHAGPGGITEKHDTFALGETVRKQMERGQFDYLTGKAATSLTQVDAGAFGDPYADGTAKTALNPRDSPYAGRLGALDDRAIKLCDDSWANGAYGADLDAARGTAVRTLAAISDEMEAVKDPTSADAKNLDARAVEALKAYDTVISQKESNWAALNATSYVKQKVVADSLMHRLERMLDDPFIKTSASARTLQAEKIKLDKVDDIIRAVRGKPENEAQTVLAQVDAALGKIGGVIDDAETNLKKVGEYGAATAYTRFINRMMDPDPARRPSASELLKTIESLDEMDPVTKKQYLDTIDPIVRPNEAASDTAMPVRFLAERLSDEASARDILKKVLGQADANDPMPQPTPPQQPPEPQDLGHGNDPGGAGGPPGGQGPGAQGPPNGGGPQPATRDGGYI